MFGWFRERAAQAEAAQKRRKQENEARLEARIAKRKEAMLSRPCPINGMQNCQERCVHFRDGYIIALPDLSGGMMYLDNGPKCKLWHDC